MEHEIFDELLEYELELGRDDYLREASGRFLETKTQLDVIRHGPLLRTLLARPLDRRDLEAKLGVSRATSHRLVHWLEETGYGERVDNRYRLTGLGLAVAYGVLRFERYVRTAHRLDPLFEYICEDHHEFVVEPFADATVTAATPADPYAPVSRALALLRESETVRAVNLTPLFPPTGDPFGDLFGEKRVELVALPDSIERLREADPDRFDEARSDGRLTVTARGRVPYGLVVFDDRVGICGYDQTTGAVRVFVDTDAVFAREWATRVFELFRADSEPGGLDPDSDSES